MVSDLLRVSTDVDPDLTPKEKCPVRVPLTLGTPMSCPSAFVPVGHTPSGPVVPGEVVPKCRLDNPSLTIERRCNVTLVQTLFTIPHVGGSESGATEVILVTTF